jgi:hypothetical protein
MNKQPDTLKVALEALEAVCGTSSQGAPVPATPICMPEQDPSTWKEDFHRWALMQCLYLPRDFGGMKALHRDFCDWCITHQSVPCTCSTFERLVQLMGFLAADGLISGLILKEDLACAKGPGGIHLPLSGGSAHKD